MATVKWRRCAVSSATSAAVRASAHNRSPRHLTPPTAKQPSADLFKMATLTRSHSLAKVAAVFCNATTVTYKQVNTIALCYFTVILVSFFAHVNGWLLGCCRFYHSSLSDINSRWQNPRPSFKSSRRRSRWRRAGEFADVFHVGFTFAFATRNVAGTPTPCAAMLLLLRHRSACRARRTTRHTVASPFSLALRLACG